LDSKAWLDEMLDGASPSFVTFIDQSIDLAQAKHITLCHDSPSHVITLLHAMHLLPCQLYHARQGKPSQQVGTWQKQCDKKCKKGDGLAALESAS